MHTSFEFVPKINIRTTLWKYSTFRYHFILAYEVTGSKELCRTRRRITARLIKDQPRNAEREFCTRYLVIENNVLEPS
jgi:hypothetical protein